MKLAATALGLLVLCAGGIELDFNDLSDFDYEQGKELPKKVTKYHGKKVEIVGFMRGLQDEVDDLEAFWLVNQNCDCAGTPRMNERVLCTMPEGQTVSISDEPVRALGVLEVGEDGDGEYVFSIYRLAVRELK